MDIFPRRRKSRRPKPGAAPGSLVLPAAAPEPVIRLMDYTPERLEERVLASPSEIVPYLTDATPSITWVDVQGLGNLQVLQELQKIFDIHPLALADVVNVPQRPKVDAYDRYLFIITRMGLPTQNGGLHTEQVSLFVGRDFVLTFQETYGDCLDPVRERIRKGSGMIRKCGADYLAYAILDALVDGYFPLVEAAGERIENLEDGIVLSPEPSALREVYGIRRDLLEIRRGVWPQREALNALLHDESGFFSKSVHPYLRDCYDHVVQILEISESQRELASGLLDVYLSSVANRTNEVMKILTVVTTIFIPLSFIAGVYGMNFSPDHSAWNMPELRWRYGSFFALAEMLAVALLLLGFFWKKGWLRSNIWWQRNSEGKRTRRARRREKAKATGGAARPSSP